MSDLHIIARTFDVSDVAAAMEPVNEMPYPDAVASFLGASIESCSWYDGTPVRNVVSHPLIAALHAGYASHHPVCLSPDIVWLTITQGVSSHPKPATNLRVKVGH